MINKTVCFICNLDNPFDINDIYYKGLGGSETWVINMVMKLSEYYHIILFNQNNYTVTYSDFNKGIDIYPLDYLDRVCSYHYFEHVFFNRNIIDDYLNIFKKYDNCNNIHCIVHDLRLWKTYVFYINDINCILTNDDINNDEYLKSHLKKIFFMSDWHYDDNKIYNYDDELISIIGNGIDIPENISFINKDNSMLWSSCRERGLDLFINKIMPKIINKIPDFKLNIAIYNNQQDLNELNSEHIQFLGSLSKQELYNEMQKHKVSFLPLNHWETFCISALEHIINGTIFLSPFKYGLQTTFKYFKDIMLKDGNYEDNEYCEYVANEIIDKINNYNKYINIQKILYLYIKDNYSWESISHKFYNTIKLYEKDNSYYM